jgi:FKBP-type peptidyl-prolyl cis-trans isomerase 2
MEEGDIVEFEFDAYIKETEELIETTHEELAKEHDLFDENREYKPIPVIVGKDKGLAQGLNEHMVKKAEVGKDQEVTVAPEKAYGVRDPKLVELHSKREIMRLPEFSKGDAFPYVGMQIILKNRPAWISAITAGRIRVDFNHRFAGKTLLYKYKVVKTIDKLEDKVNSILDMHYSTKDEFQIDINKKKKQVDVVLPDICKYDNKWTLAKYAVIADLRDVTKMEVIRFVEEYVKKEEKKEEKEKPAEEVKEDKPAEEAKEDNSEASIDGSPTEEVVPEEKPVEENEVSKDTSDLEDSSPQETDEKAEPEEAKPEEES